MATKSFKTAPSKQPAPTAETIDGFIKGGKGTDKSEPTVRLSLDVPESLHTRFKLVCTKARAKMAPEVIAMIERMTEEMEQKHS